MKLKEVWNKGKKLSHETRKKMSISQKGGNSTSFKKANIPHNKGVTNWIVHSEETKEKISKSLKDSYAKNQRKGFKKGVYMRYGFKKNNKPYNTGKSLSKETKEKIRKKRYAQKNVFSTSIEVKIQNYLKQLGYEFFIHQYIKEIEHGYQCDILIPSMNLVVECDGNYWHKYPTGREIDHIRTSELLQKGFKVLRLWECEIRHMKINDFKIILEVSR